MTARFNDSEILQATGATKTRAGTALSFEGVCTDSRELTDGCLFVALQGDRFDAHDFLAQAVRDGAAGLVVNAGRAGALEGLDVSIYEVKDTLHALGRLARFHRDRFNIPIAAVTGSNGKTTTKELVASILSKKLTEGLSPDTPHEFLHERTEGETVISAICPRDPLWRFYFKCPPQHVGPPKRSLGDGFKKFVLL